MKEDYKKLVEMIDGCVKNGSGHINVKIGEEDSVTQCNSSCQERGACCVPTIHRGIDE